MSLVNNVQELVGALVAITDVSNNSFNGYLFDTSALQYVIIDGAKQTQPDKVRVHLSVNLSGLFGLRQIKVKGSTKTETNFHSNTYINIALKTETDPETGEVKYTHFSQQLISYAEKCVGKFKKDKDRLDLFPGCGINLMRLKAAGPAARVMIQMGEPSENIIDGETSIAFPPAAIFLGDVLLEPSLASGNKTEIDATEELDFEALGFVMPKATPVAAPVATKPLPQKPAFSNLVAKRPAINL